MNDRRATPEQCHIVPCERTTDYWEVDGQGCGAVSEVEAVQVEVVDDKEDEREAELSVHPRESKCEDQNVVQNEVATHIGGRNGMSSSEQMEDESNLTDQNYHPIYVHNGRVQRERRGVCFILAPDGLILWFMVGILRCIPCEMDVGNVNEQKGGDGQELVCKDRSWRDCVMLVEWVVLIR